MQPIINIQEVNTELIDEVSLGIYQQDIVLGGDTVFGEPFRSRSNIFSLYNYIAPDFIDSSLTRAEIAKLKEVYD